jgi:Family of unknown function (DUF5681)
MKHELAPLIMMVITTETPLSLRTGVPAVPGGEAYRFKKGQSGNPGGRPKKRVLTQALLAVLDQLVPGDVRKRTNAQAIAETLVALAMKGHLGAVHELADRTEGRAPIVSIDKSLDESIIEDEVFDSSKADPDQDRNRRVE